MIRFLALSSILVLTQVCSAQATFPASVNILATTIGTYRDVAVSVIVTGSGLYVSATSSDPQIGALPLTLVAAGSNALTLRFTPTHGGQFSAIVNWSVFKAQGFSADNPALVGTATTTVSSVANDNTFMSSGSPGVLGEPVSTATGELFEPAIPPDLSLGGPLPLRFGRYYASFLRVNGIVTALGSNWMHNFDYRLSLVNNTATVTTPGGHGIVFQSISSGWQVAGGEKLGYQFANGPGSSHQFMDPSDNLIYTFASDGTLSRIEDRNGNALTVTASIGGPTQVADGVGRSLHFTYDGSGHLTRVQDQTGRSVSFTYTGDDLTQVTDANGKSETYSYTATGIWTGLMTSTVRPAGNKPFTQIYDSSGRVAKQSDSGGNATTLGYDSAGVTSFSNPVGVVSSHSHQGYYRLIKYTDPDGASVTFTYDTNGRRISNTDRFGDKTSVTYHTPSGYIGSKTDALQNTTTYTYAAQTQGSFTFYNLIQIRYADSTTTSYSYDGFGNRTSFADEAGKVSRLTYNTQGQVMTETNPLGGISAYTYNADGTLASVQDAAGNLTTYTYDDKKRVAQRKYADNTIQAFTYDNLDHILSSVDERGKTVAFAYDDNGNLKSATDAAGKPLVNSYNSDDRLVSTTDRLGGNTTRTYDENGMPKTVVNPVGETITYTYDTHNRLSSILDPSGKGVSINYDVEDVPTSLKDALGRTWNFTTDKLGRTTRLTSPQSENVDVIYNRAGKIVSRRNPLGQTINFTYDSRKLLSKISLPLGISESYTRNDMGLITGVTDPNGNVWTSKFDAAGRLLSRVDPLSRVISYTYDSRNRAASSTTTAGSANFSYDAAGNLLRRLYDDGTEFDYTYDDSHRLLTASGVSLAYDADGRIVSSNGLVITRDGAGRIASIVYGPGKTVTYRYNFRGLLASVTDWAGGETDLTYDDAAELVTIARPNGAATQYTYDNDGRLSGIAESAGASIALTRDAAGKIVSADRNLPQAPQPAPGSSLFSYDAAQQISGATYDGLGRLSSDGLRTYTWDAASRLTSYSGADGAASFTYDGLGTRTGRNAETYRINYALKRPSIATVNTTNGEQRYYVYLPDGRLLHSIGAADNSRHFFHFDETGSTVFLTDDSGAISDSYGITPYGETVSHAGSSSNPFTWRGAYGVFQEDATSLFYVQGRYYDSSAARFLSPGPIAGQPFKLEGRPETGQMDPILPQEESGRSSGNINFSGNINTDLASQCKVFVRTSPAPGGPRGCGGILGTSGVHAEPGCTRVQKALIQQDVVAFGAARSPAGDGLRAVSLDQSGQRCGP